MTTRDKLWITTPVFLWLCAAAHAQHASENVLTSSEDAFGKTVGVDSIGIYGSDNVRGFSPIVAGNVRVEGLYFDIQGSPTGRVIADSTIHVGIAAQGDSFPAPTGITDLSLRGSDARSSLSIIANAGPFASRGLIFDGTLSLRGAQLTTAVGASMARDHLASGGRSTSMSVGVVPRWHPSEHIEIASFWGRSYVDDENPTPIYVPGVGLPPRINQGHYPGPSWLGNSYHSDTAGIIGHAAWSDWTIRSGLFYSAQVADAVYSNLFVGITPQGEAEQVIIAGRPQHASSVSGELRASRAIQDGSLRHLLLGTVRWRNSTTGYGGDAVIDAGMVNVNAPQEMTKPAFEFGEPSHARRNQIAGGLSYRLAWEHVGEFGVGLQRTTYRKRDSQPDVTPLRGTTSAWLPNVTLALPMGSTLTAYGSYTAGLEDSANAPDNASNRGEPVAAIRTYQHDIGLRWTPSGSIKLIAGYFEITKPYLTTGSDNVYRRIGNETHRGVEVSITATAPRGLTTLMGGVFSRPLVNGTIASDGADLRPVAQPGNTFLLAWDYVLPFAPRWSVDAQVNHVGSQMATADNTVRLPSYTTVALGGRYKFTLNGKSCLLRLSVDNATDVRSWKILSSGAYQANGQRSLSAYVAADF